MAVRKNIRFDYYKVFSRKYNETRNVMEETPCDLSDVFNFLKSIPTSKRIYGVGGDEARLQDLNFQNNKWALHFIRIRKNGFPIVTHDDGSYTFLDNLGDEEGLGEEVSVIFDPSNCIIMIRRNMHSLAPTAISNYLTNVVNKPGYTIFFKPLIHPRARVLLERDHLIRGAEISITDVKNSKPSTKKSLGRIINNADDINESVSIYFKISIQPKGSKKTSRLPVYEDLDNMIDDPTIQSLKVRRKADEDARVEPVDLISHRLVDYHTFTKNDFDEKSRNILHTTVISKMLSYYRTRVEEINNVYI